jgi:electron transport complex protein RnfB
MHAVMPSLCSGCKLCVAPCPVDCIRLEGATHDWSPDDARAARDRHQARAARLARGERVSRRTRDAATPAGPPTTPRPTGMDEGMVAAGASVAPAVHDGAAKRHAAIAAALARARARRARHAR